MHTLSVRRVALSVLLASVLILMAVSSAFAADLTPPGDVKPKSWDPNAQKWTPGQNNSYWEGETAAMAVELTTKVGTAYDLPICLQVWETPLPTKAYLFTKFEPFNTTARTKPTELPGGELIDYGFPAPWVNVGTIYGYNINITKVTENALGTAGCDPNYIGVTISYVRNNSDPSYILWGGHIAKQGDALPLGSPNTTVPAGKSAGFSTGVFQSRLKTSAADATLDFKVLYGPNAVVLSGVSATSSLPVVGFVLVGLFVLTGGVFGWKRLQQH